MQKTKISPKRAVVYARYFLPLLTGLVLLILSFFYLVRYFQMGDAYEQTLWNFYKNTFTASHTYLAGELQAGKNALYGWLTAGAILGILCYIAGLFFSGLAALMFCRAHRTLEETPDARRAKLIFKIAFPNRICLFLSNCLFLVTAAYPQFFSFITARVASTDRRELLYIDRNLPLAVTWILVGLTLVLAVYAGFAEEKAGLDPFHLQKPLSVPEDEIPPDGVENTAFSENEA